MSNAVKGASLQKAVEKVVQQVRSRGVEITSDELIGIVKAHAKGSAASMAATGALPGVGSTIAAGVEIGFVWSMYYRIATRLGINVKKEVMKTLGSAIITNVAGSIAAQLIAGTVLSIFPGIGSIGAATVNALMGYSITYYSGIIFMNLLVRIFAAGGKLEDMTAEELKEIAKSESARTSFASIKDEAKAAYKNRANDAAASVLEDEESSRPIRITPRHSFWLHLGIDFGSTNSVMAWRLYRWDESGTWTADEQYNTQNNIVRCPTMLVYKKDNENHPVVQAEKEEVIAGRRAEELANDSQDPAVAVTSFKQGFYDSLLNSPEQMEAADHIAVFMKHLYKLFESEILARLPEKVQKDMSITVHISTPVRAGAVHRKMMKDLAIHAGFVHDGESCFIDTSRNEAECVMHLAVDRNAANIAKLMEMSMAKSALNILFVDIGGSTTDIELIKQEMHAAQNSAQVLAMWPRGNMQYMLGGQEVDRAIFEYLLETECLIPEYANRSWEHGTAKTLFRKLKENNNLRLKEGIPVSKLGTIPTSCGDPDEEERPAQKYKDHIITKEVFEQRICRRYISDLNKALHDVLRGSMEEGDVDAVFVTGAGSRLYFIHDLLLGNIGDDPIRLTQIQNDPGRLFDSFEDPATCCAEGAISGVV